MNTQLNDLFEAMTSRIDESLGSLFTKDDVKKLLGNLLEQCTEALDTPQTSGSIDPDKFSDNVRSLLEDIADAEIADIDYSSAEFDIRNGDTIVLESVDVTIDWEQVIDKLTDNLHKLS